MAFLDTIWSALSIVDNVLDGGRARQGSTFELATNHDDEEESAQRVANDRQIRQSANLAQAQATASGRALLAQQAQATDRAAQGDVAVGHLIGAQSQRGEGSPATIAPLSAAVDSDAFVGSPIRPLSERDAAAAQVNRRAGAIALFYRTSGEMEAAREMRARTRDLSPALAGEVVVAARVTLEGIAAAIGRVARSEADGATPMPDRSTRLQQVVIDVAATIEHAARGPRGELIARETAGLILDAAGHGGDEYRLSAFARGVPFGIGLTLPLALAAELSRQGDRRRQRQILLAIEQGLTRLKHRIAAAASALAELTLPLAGLLAAEFDTDAIDRERLAAALGTYVTRHAHFLDAFADRLDRVDAVGNDAFCILDALARRSEIPPELCSIRSDLLAGPATAFVIAQSGSAHETALRHGTAGDPRTAAPSIEMTMQGVRRVYAGLGFSGARSVLLAAAAMTWRSVAQMDAGWTASSCSPDAAEQGRAFDTLLRFCGAGAPSRHIRVIALSDIDDETLILPAGGLSLLRRLELTP